MNVSGRARIRRRARHPRAAKRARRGTSASYFGPTPSAPIRPIAGSATFHTGELRARPRSRRRLRILTDRDGDVRAGVDRRFFGFLSRACVRSLTTVLSLKNTHHPRLSRVPKDGQLKRFGPRSARARHSRVEEMILLARSYPIRAIRKTLKHAAGRIFVRYLG